MSQFNASGMDKGAFPRKVTTIRGKMAQGNCFHGRNAPIEGWTACNGHH